MKEEEMNEEEAKEILLNLSVDKYIDERKLDINDVEAIITLLDLYEKEKKKNKKLENSIDNREFTWKQKYEETFSYIDENYISKDKIRNLILKYRCFGWHNKDDEYWANRILDEFEQCLEEE